MPEPAESGLDRWHEKTVLITGVCGTIGRELLRQLLAGGAREIVGIDNNESALFFLQDAYREHANVRLFLGDVCDAHALRYRMQDVDVILHTAAFKHVMLCERSPGNAVSTNIHGVQNVIEAALAANVERVLFTSSDKAVNPTNVMGTSKLMGERLMSAADGYRRDARPVFASTRFGNVLGSRGSVIPLFRRQIAAGGPVTLTHPGMTRFIMTLAEAVRLVTESTFLARGGEVFVTKMPVARISDLAEVMIEELAPKVGRDPGSVRIEVVGAKPGEKMYEELLNDEEIRRVRELPSYFVVLPAFTLHDSVAYSYPGMLGSSVERPYNSALETPMSREELREFLRRGGFFEEDESDADPGSGW